MVIRPLVSLWKLPVVGWCSSFSCAHAAVQVDFSHSYVGAPGGFQNEGAITQQRSHLTSVFGVRRRAIAR